MKTYSILATFLLAALSPVVAQAVEIASTDFTDPNNDGELTGDTDGTGWSGGWLEVDEDNSGIVKEALNYLSPDGVAVNAASALHVTGEGSEDSGPGPPFSLTSRNLTGFQNGDDIYISFLTKYEAGSIDSADFYAWSYGDPADLGDPTIGIRANGGPGATDFFARDQFPNMGFAGEQLAVGETYFVVGRLWKTASGASFPYTQYDIWVNPVHGEKPPPGGISHFQAFDVGGFGQVGFFSANNVAGDDVRFGRLRIGTTWEDVVPPPSLDPYDLEGDGDRDETDFDLLLGNLYGHLDGLNPSGNGDVNFDGRIDLADVADFKATVPALFAAGKQIPEPTTMSLGLLLFSIVCCRRRRRSSSKNSESNALASGIPVASSKLKSSRRPGVLGTASKFSVCLTAAGLLAVLAPTAAAQTSYFWVLDVTGSWDDTANWRNPVNAVPAFPPRADMDQIGLIAQATAQLSSAAAFDAGGVIVGDDPNFGPGTLHIQSGGTLNFVAGTSGALGSVEVGRLIIDGQSLVEAEGHLIVDRGGTLNAVSLVNRGLPASSTTLGSGNAGTATVTINGPAALLRNTRVIGNNVNFSAQSLEIGGTFTAEISGNSHSALKASGFASLDGDLVLDFGGVAPPVGQFYDLVDADSVAGSFDSVAADVPAGMGLTYLVTNVAGGTNGTVTQVGRAVELQLLINRRSGATKIKNLTTGATATSATIEGYGVIAPDGILDETQWTRFTAGGTWVGNGSSTHVGESSFTGSRAIGPGAAIDLGNIYAFEPTQLLETNEKIQFEYLLDGGRTAQGAVDFTGPYNNLVLVVDEEENSVFIQNQSELDLEIDGYGIISESGSLDAGQWNGINQSDAAWDPGPDSDNHLSEVNYTGSRLFEAFNGDFLDVGQIFRSGAEQDLVFEYSIAGVSGVFAGNVEYEEGLQAPVDFDNDGDGDVDGFDFLLIQRNDPLLIPQWAAEFGTTGSSVVAAAIPEPTTCLLAVIGLICVAGRRLRDDDFTTCEPIRACPRLRISLMKTLVTIAAFISIGLAPVVAQAVEIASMDFTDPNNDGELDGDTDGSGWAAGPWVSDVDISAIVLEGFSYTSPDGVQVNTATSVHIECPAGLEHCNPVLPGAAQFLMSTRGLASTHAQDEVYISFLTKWEAGTPHFGDFTGWNYGTSLGSAPTIGIRANGEGPNDEDFFARDRHMNEAWSPTQLEVGETYFVVGRLSKTESGPDNPYTSHEVWVNPVHGTAPPPPADAISVFPPEREDKQFSEMGLFVANWDEGDEARVGRLRLGTTWVDVVPQLGDFDGDFDGDGTPDVDDFNTMVSNLYRHIDGVRLLHEDGDITSDGQIDLRDYKVFKANFPAVVATATGVPEPTTIGLVLVALVGLVSRTCCRR